MIRQAGCGQTSKDFAFILAMLSLSESGSDEGCSLLVNDKTWPWPAPRDIWAFGVVLYEVLTGRRLFAGNTVSDVLAAVLRQDVGLETLPADGYNNAGQSAAARVLHRATDATVNRPRSRCSREPRERQQRKESAT